ncbi:MAG: hypothetical protein IJR31_03420, partial [Lachnospiraceae bacterium]|nr:hypothetical protein [Lachnospiraceae bacterium]
MDNIQLHDLKRHKEDLNKTGGINTKKSVFNTGEESEENDNPYAMSSRVEQLANYGPLMASRIHTQNPNDIAFSKQMEREQGERSKEDENKIRSEEKSHVIKAQPDLKVFSGEVMEKGVFTPKAKEAARHFFKQISDWAGNFDDGGSGFYDSMGISSVLDCLYVDGMSLRSYLKEQYYYKTTGNPAQDQESLRNYVALIAARGDHVITLVRPNVKGDEAEVEYRNLYLDMSEVGEDEAGKSKKLKEKGNQVRNTLKKRIDDDMTERTGRAYRKAFGCESDGFSRLEKAKDGLRDAKDGSSDEYRDFDKSYSHYSTGLQKLGLKPGRDDINLPVAQELKRRCEEAIRAAEAYLASEPKDKKTIHAVESAKKALETDLSMLEKAVNSRLVEESARMKLTELLEGGAADERRTPGAG